MIHGEPRKPMKIGTVQTVDIESGEVVETKRNAMTMLPCGPDVCQTCATDHRHDEPHNRDSLYYQMTFHATHGRWPLWSDSMAHCTPEVQALWRKALARHFESRGLEIPEDIRDDKTGGR